MTEPKNHVNNNKNKVLIDMHAYTFIGLLLVCKCVISVPLCIYAELSGLVASHRSHRFFAACKYFPVVYLFEGIPEIFPSLEPKQLSILGSGYFLINQWI